MHARIELFSYVLTLKGMSGPSPYIYENRILGGPQGFWGSGENGYLFSGNWGALVIILGELGSKLIILGIKGALPKSKKKKIRKSLHFVVFFKKFLLLLGG